MTSDSAFLLRVLISAIGFNDLENLLSHPIPEILDKHVQFFYKVHIESSIKYKEHADIDALYLSTLSFILSHCKSDWCEYLTTHLNTNTLHLIDSLTILTQNNKVDISDTLDHLKEYILHSTTHNDAIIASLSRCLLTLFKFSGDDALLVSTIHTLLNHLSFSTTALITHLTLQLNRSQITNLSTSIFLQNLDTYPKSADIAHHLIALAPITPHSTFIEIAKAIAHLDDSFNAQKAMAKQSLSDKYLSSAVLEHYLKLFIQASQNNSNKVSLGEYVDVIAILMRDDDNHAESDSISAKLRKFWIIVATQSLPDSNALHEIALKSPALVFTQADITAHSAINEKRAFLTTILPRNAGDIRYLSSDQVVLLITLYKLEGIRCAHCRPSTLLAYLDGDIFSDASSTECLKGISDLLTHTFISEWIAQSKVQSIDLRLLEHIKALLIASCHRLEIVRTIAFRFADRVLTAIPDLVSKSVVIYTVLELLSLLHQSCANHMEFEYSFRFNYASSLAAFQIDLPDSSAVKNGLVERLSRALDRWIVSALPGSNLELNSTLSSYLDETNEASPTHYGASLALRYSLKIPPNDSHLASKSQLDEDLAGAFANRFGLRCKTNGEITGVRLALKKGVNEMHKIPDNEISKEDVRRLKKQTQDLLYGIYNKECDLTLPDLKRLLWRCAGILIASNKLDFELLHFLVSVPFQVFTGDSISIALEVWTWLFHERVDFQTKIIMEISSQWLGTIKARKGLFSPSEMDPFHAGIEYSPSNEEELNSHCISIKKTFLPHLYVIHLINGLLTTVESNDPIAIVTVSKCLHRSMQSGLMSRHPLSREVRFTILNTAFRLLKSSSLDETSEAMMRESTLHCALAWFDLKPQWCFGGNKLQLKSDMQCLEMFLHNVKTDGRIQSHSNSTHNNKMKLLELLLDNEISKLKVWLDPLNESDRGGYLPTLIQGTTITEFEWHRHVHTAWSHSPELLMGLASRFKSPTISREVKKLTRKHTNCFVNVSESLEYLLDGGVHEVSPSSLRLLNFWAPVSPSVALTYFQPEYRNHSIVLQYAMKCLEHHSVDLTFFYVPQIVQALRDDKLGYVERFIFETAKISQLFCHQIIWNMKANTHRDDNGELEDPMKPLLERMINMIVSSLSGDAKEFFEREFSFFDSVTSISGKLKPFVKKSKPEKKSKIDEEMQRIDVDPGVYLPSNPDGVVVDIDKVSGRPLQSHAKAPFMATFKVRKEFVNLQSPDGILDTEQEEKKQVLEKWQAAIFKVGDDCRQDVLALQAIAIFKTIFSSAGIALYLNPYRVTATGPGCGVIDVVPNATSRDEMGRAKVNDLAIYFLQTFGSKESLAYQKSRLNFIRSMAAYSLICYILQVKDRHNGNIMIDGEGHIVHIDFGFLFDIGPGGIKFEPNSFKLSHEMVTVMGGRDSDGYKMFQELIIKGFIAARIYAHEIVNVVKLMLGTELPSFKGEGTIYRLRERFMLHLDDRAASTYMLGVIRNAHENSRSIAYDEFQRITNDIPYAL
ncbi:Phosphatidylinositol 4-kinase stt4 [Wallemia ichthyophaga EXF-994]|uniref:1-phosphatidylinositol 4-kinase n=1 Tax=Wallemia ichthyophaga (strain EXF-994 / CBS 113033) TaxID=1299270 RepID=R9AFW4_WALI9|nr:Phosphatidylinositol 4-kinase stt4 [Wallemia ichthyophaga EXF-994]EOR01015.1 Phosphatidylinositol 4-kinase stt4 [Wallemia ichthyophaga EXF-994]